MDYVYVAAAASASAASAGAGIAAAGAAGSLTLAVGLLSLGPWCIDVRNAVGKRQAGVQQVELEFVDKDNSNLVVVVDANCMALLGVENAVDESDAGRDGLVVYLSVVASENY